MATTDLERIAKQLDATADALDNQRGRTSNYPKSAWRAAVAAGQLVVEAVKAGGFDEAARQLVARIQHPRDDARFNTVFLQMCQSWMKPRNSHIDAHGGSYSYPDAMRLLAGELVKLKRAVASNDQQKQSGQRTAERTTKKNLVPQNPQVVAFLNRLNRDLGSDDYPTKTSIAMDITGQDERKAMNLLRQARRFSDLLRAGK